MWRRAVKLLPELGAVGVMGALGAGLVLSLTAPPPGEALAEYAAVRQGIAAINRWLLLPSLVLVLLSGLLAIAATRAYMDAGWPWLKALSTVAMFEGTLLTVHSSGRKAAEIATLAASSGEPDLAALEPLLRTEWIGGWTILALSLGNILLAVWRPRLRRPAAD